VLLLEGIDILKIEWIHSEENQQLYVFKMIGKTIVGQAKESKVSEFCFHCIQLQMR
jgi:hypothetical protein